MLLLFSLKKIAICLVSFMTTVPNFYLDVKPVRPFFYRNGELVKNERAANFDANEKRYIIFHLFNFTILYSL